MKKTTFALATPPTANCARAKPFPDAWAATVIAAGPGVKTTTNVVAANIKSVLNSMVVSNHWSLELAEGLARFYKQDVCESGNLPVSPTY